MSRIGSLAVIGTLSLFGLLACGDKINPAGAYPKHDASGGGGNGGNVEAGAIPSYTYDIAPLLKKSCLCHVQGGEAPLLDTYTNVKNSAAVSMQSINDGSMPPGSVDLPSASEKDLLQSWINAGMPNN